MLGRVNGGGRDEGMRVQGIAGEIGLGLCDPARHGEVCVRLSPINFCDHIL